MQPFGTETCIETETANLRISCISAFQTVCNRNHDLWLQEGLIRETSVKNGTRPGRAQFITGTRSGCVPNASSFKWRRLELRTRSTYGGRSRNHGTRSHSWTRPLDRVASAG